MPNDEKVKERTLVEPTLKDGKTEIKVTWCLLLKNRHFSYTLLVCFFGTINIVYFYGYIGPYLLTLDFSEHDIGFVIAS